MAKYDYPVISIEAEEYTAMDDYPPTKPKNPHGGTKKGGKKAAKKAAPKAAKKAAKKPAKNR